MEISSRLLYITKEELLLIVFLFEASIAFAFSARNQQQYFGGNIHQLAAYCFTVRDINRSSLMREIIAQSTQKSYALVGT
jgi:hypothetical protein